MLESWGCGLYTSAAYTRVFMVVAIFQQNFSSKYPLYDWLCVSLVLSLVLNLIYMKISIFILEGMK